MQQKFLNLSNITAFLSKNLDNYQIITLSGDLGAGKTTLVKKLAKSLNIDENEVTSPTFAILNIYHSKKREIWHYDLYRIKNTQELKNIDLEHSIENHLTIIEWPEIAQNFLPKKGVLAIEIKILDKNDEREYFLQGN